jgi:hypothetical protein
MFVNVKVNPIVDLEVIFYSPQAYHLFSFMIDSVIFSSKAKQKTTQKNDEHFINLFENLFLFFKLNFLCLMMK